MKRHYHCRFVCFLAVCLLGGCSSQPPPTAPAKGKILGADGKPIHGGYVMFWPLDNPKEFVKRYDTVPVSVTNERGEFEMWIMSPDRIGVPPGKYRVTVHEIAKENNSRVPQRYRKDDTTPWEVTIPAKGMTDIVSEDCGGAVVSGLGSLSLSLGS